MATPAAPSAAPLLPGSSSTSQPAEAAAQANLERVGSVFMRKLSEGSGKSMEWTDLNFSIKDKAILQAVAGSVASREMACILGPSGAGKSTLLNLLAGRMNTRRPGMAYTGSVSMNGTPVQPVDVRSRIAYVMQEDALPGLSTPRECLRMSAMLRLAGTRNDLFGEVNEILEALHLTKCADTYVGTQLIKGISGGEKKRTAVAVELITRPAMVFLDEPLSGLDSYAAWTVVQALKELAQNGCAVLCTVHQPSSEIFQCFSKMICLAEGKVCYCGPVPDLSEYMAKTGFPVPNHYNPADHILFHVQKCSTEELGAFTGFWAERERAMVLPKIQEIRGSAESGATVPVEPTRRKSFFVQLEVVTRREWREVVRNKWNLVMRFGVNGFVGLLFACIFLGIGDKSDTFQGMQSHFGAVCNIMIGSMFQSAQPLTLQFPFERPIFLREYAANMYGVLPYFLSKTLLEIPVSALVSVETILIGYYLMDFQGNIIYLAIAQLGLSLAAASLALLISCAVAHPQSAQELSPLVFVPQLMFSGLFITVDLIPSWMRWLQYTCALKYAINIACLIEFESVEGGDEFLKHMKIERDQIWVYVGILIGIMVVFRAAAVLVLRRKASFVY